MTTKTTILALALAFVCSLPVGCVPLLAGGMIGYGVSRHEQRIEREHQEFLQRERDRLERERWGHYHYPPIYRHH